MNTFTKVHVLATAVLIFFANSLFAQPWRIFGDINRSNDQRQEEIRTGSNSYYSKLKRANEARKDAKDNAEKAYNKVQDSLDNLEATAEILEAGRKLRKDYLSTLDNIERSFELNLMRIFERQQV